MKAVKYFDTPTLMRLIREGNERGYNRRLDPAEIERIADPDGKHVVTFTMGHEHIAGEISEPHVRMVFFLKEIGVDEPRTRLTMDLNWNNYNALPTHLVEEASV